MSEAYTLLDAAYAAARWGWYLTVFLTLGAGSYAPFLIRVRTGLPATHPEFAVDLGHRAARIGLVAACLLLPIVALRLYLQSRTLLDPEEPLTGEFLRAVIGSAWGRGWVRQALMSVVAALAFGAAVKHSRLGWLVAVASTGGLGIAAGMTGHAATARSGPGGLLLDAAHVWAGGLWLGGLAVLAIAGLGACRRLPPEERSAMVRMLVADFSRRALLFGPAAIGLGVWLAVRYLGWGWPFHLFESRYGVTLAIKLGALTGVALLGAYNWRVVQPGLAHPAGEKRLERSSLLELAFGLTLLAVTAVLVALPLPGDM